MFRRLTFAALLASLLPASLLPAPLGLGPAAAEPRNEAAGKAVLPPFDCVGPFTADASEAALVRRFGRANVVFKTVPAPEGEMVNATVLFPKDRARRVEIVWRDEKKRRRPGEVLVYNPGPWRTPEGIKIGSTLAEVEAANGNPFSLSGFGWDYAGTVLDWKGGRLVRGGCELMLRFEPSGSYDEQASGDQEFQSDQQAMLNSKPVVYQMMLLYGRNGEE